MIETGGSAAIRAASACGTPWAIRPWVIACGRVPASPAAYLTGHRFFPSLISAPFEHGLAIAFGFSIAACLIAAVASLLRGRRYVHEENGPAVRADRTTQELVRP